MNAPTDIRPEALTPDGTLAFVRGFMLFSLLANLAEERHRAAEAESQVSTGGLHLSINAIATALRNSG